MTDKELDPEIVHFWETRKTLGESEQDDLWTRLTAGLEADERIVSPKDYIENQDLYAGIKGVGFIVRYISEDQTYGTIDWVFQSALDRIVANNKGTIEIVEKQLLVTLRLPWTGLESEWLITQEELDAHREEYKVLEIYLKLRSKDDPSKVVHSSAVEYDSNWDKYDVIEARYLVCWKFTPETESRLLGIDESSFTRFLEQ